MAERPLRIVIVSWHFPPSQEIGGKVVWRLAKHLALLGCELRVLAGPEEEIRYRDDEYTSALPPRLEIVRTPVRLNLVEAALAFLKRAPPADEKAANPPPAAPAQTSTDPAEHPTGFREFIRLLVSFHRYDRWIGPAARELRRMLAAEPADLVLSVSPVFAAHWAVKRVQRDLRGSLWFAWLHDPGMHYIVATDRLQFSTLRYSPLGRFTAHRRADAERKTIESATRLVVTAQALADEYVKLLPHLRTPALAPCGFDIEESRPASRVDVKLVFVYVGTIYLLQTPRPIIESLARLRAAGVYSADELEVRFVGRLENEEGQQLESVIAALGMGDVISVSGQVPHAEALRIIGDATVGLAMAEQLATQIPAKVYEYIAMRRPVFTLGDGATRDLVLENRIGYVCDRDGLDETLTALIVQWRRDRLAVFQPALEDAAQRYSMENIAKNLFDEIRADVNSASKG